jgi:intracellular sulfur oxidation DsrE/DsrF family protein
MEIMNKAVSLLLAIALSTVSVNLMAAGADGGYAKQKVVYHINYDDPKKQKGAMRNIQNHINAVGKEKLDLQVVMHGNGLSLLARASEDMNFQSQVLNLKGQGIEFKVCANTLRDRKISYEDDLFDVNKADIVPSGVAELADLQSKGYSYIKP